MAYLVVFFYQIADQLGTGLGKELLGPPPVVYLETDPVGRREMGPPGLPHNEPRGGRMRGVAPTRLTEKGKFRPQQDDPHGQGDRQELPEPDFPGETGPCQQTDPQESKQDQQALGRA